MKNLIFWGFLTVPVLLLFIAFPWLMIPYFIVGIVCAGVYISEFGRETEVSGVLAAIFLPHVYLFIRLVIGGGGGWI